MPTKKPKPVAKKPSAKQQQQDLQAIVSLGYSMDMAKQALFAFKNVELAINYLLDERSSAGKADESVAQ